MSYRRHIFFGLGFATAKRVSHFRAPETLAIFWLREFFALIFLEICGLFNLVSFTKGAPVFSWSLIFGRRVGVRMRLGKTNLRWVSLGWVRLGSASLGLDK